MKNIRYNMLAVTIISLLFVTAGSASAGLMPVDGGLAKGGLDFEVGWILAEPRPLLEPNDPATWLGSGGNLPDLEKFIPKKGEVTMLPDPFRGKAVPPPFSDPDHPGFGHGNPNVPEPATVGLMLLGILIVYTGNRKHKII